MDKGERKEGWLKVRLIIEVAGTPKEYVEKAVVTVGEKFGENDSNIKVAKISVKEPTKVHESKDLWSGFLEFEADVKDFPAVMGIVFDYLPSSIEILEPEQLSSEIPLLNGILNDLAGRLHQYDMNIKLLKAKVAVLEKKLKATPSVKPSDDLTQPQEPKKGKGQVT